MADQKLPPAALPIADCARRAAQPGRSGRGIDEVHCGDDGIRKGPQSSAGFSGKPSAHSPEEHADALLELFERCRRVVKKESSA